MIIFGPSFNPIRPPDLFGDSPIVGIDNLVTAAAVAADLEDPNNPADNLANPSTALIWNSLAASAQHVTVTLSGLAYVNYLGVCGHNFGSQAIPANAQGWLGDYVIGVNQNNPSIALLSEFGYPILNENGTPLLSEASLTSIGDMTSLSAAFDGTTGQNAASSSNKAAATTAYVGRNYTPLQNGGIRVFQAVVMGSNDEGFVTGSNPSVTLNLRGKLTAPVSSSDGTLLGTATFTDTANESAGRTIASTDQVTVWPYVWIEVSVSVGATLNVAELQIFESLQNWFDLTTTVTPTDDLPLIFRFNGQAALSAIRLNLGIGLAIPTAAVIYTGRAMTFQRRVYVGHTPITMGRTTNIVSGMSESGNFLGRIVLGESRHSQVTLKNLTPSWYRSYMEPFINAAVEFPFFFAWRPSSYPNETGFCWLSSDAVPSNSLPNGMMSVQLNLTGVAS